MYVWRREEREKKGNAAGAAARERIYYIYLTLQYRIFATLAEAASLPMLPWVPKNPADRNSKGEAMRNEPSESVRVVTRCVLLCLGSRAISLSPSPGHSRALISDAETRTGKREWESFLRTISHQVNALSAQPAGIILKKFCIYTYIYIYIYVCMCIYIMICIATYDMYTCVYIFVHVQSHDSVYLASTLARIISITLPQLFYMRY